MVVSKLQKRLQKKADSKTKLWFENYLKNSIEYRGLKTPIVIKELKKWYQDEEIGTLPLKNQLSIATQLLKQKFAEDKFSGIFFIQIYLLKELESDLILEEVEKLFKQGHFYDWSTVDWFNVRVLDPLILSGPLKVAKRVASWSKAKNIWQRRSSLVAFRGASKDKRYHPLIKKNVNTLVKEDERFIQTAIGWLLSDMSKIYPKEVTQIIDKNWDYLSKEVIRRHTKHLPKRKTYLELLKKKV